jgi:hypothetical protein
MHVTGLLDLEMVAVSEAFLTSELPTSRTIWTLAGDLFLAGTGSIYRASP